MQATALGQRPPPTSQGLQLVIRLTTTTRDPRGIHST